MPDALVAGQNHAMFAPVSGAPILRAPNAYEAAKAQRPIAMKDLLGKYSPNPER